MILLKDTIFACICVCIDDSIEARFGGDRLPTAIKHFEEVITHSGNVIAVQIHFAGVILCDILYTSVRRFPGDALLDCGVHLCFDLAHGLRELE